MASTSADRRPGNSLETDPEREVRVRERAYHLWEADGKPHGRDVEYWQRARELESMEESADSGLLPDPETHLGTPRETGIEEAAAKEAAAKGAAAKEAAAKGAAAREAAAREAAAREAAAKEAAAKEAAAKEAAAREAAAKGAAVKGAGVKGAGVKRAATNGAGIKANPGEIPDRFADQGEVKPPPAPKRKTKAKPKKPA